MEDVEEFAPEHTPIERMRMVALGIGCGLLFGLLGKTWISPWFREFSSAPQCYSLLGLSGVDILFYGLFVGLPLIAFSASIPMLCQGLRILRDRQFPPKGEKVWRKTKILRGKLAALRGVILAFVLPGAYACFPVWGYFQAQKITSDIEVKKLDQSVCASNSLLDTDAYGRRSA